MAEELQNQKNAAKGEPDVEGHSHHPMTDSDPDELKTKLANDEDDDVEAHKMHGKAHGKAHG